MAIAAKYDVGKTMYVFMTNYKVHQYQYKNDIGT